MAEILFEKFEKERLAGNEAILRNAGKQMKRLFHIDGEVYREGALSAKSKEIIGLISSLVLRCDDCVNYHLIRCHNEGVLTEELEEAVAIGYTIGGSITVPHIRRLFRWWEELVEKKLLES